MLTPVKFRVLAAALLGCTVVAGVLGARAATDARLAALKATFRQPGPAFKSSALAEQDAVWRLGQTLFNDPVLSASGRLACATCHQPGHGWSNGEPRAIGDGGKRLAFKAPTLLGVAHLDRYGWTGRFPDMAAVTTFAITSPNNMALPLADLASRLGGRHVYDDAFKTAFGDDAVDGGRIVRALGVYVASLRADAPFDHWIAGDDDAIGTDATRGFAIFTGKGRCADCHLGASLTDGSFHDVGTSDDPGRGKLFKSSVMLQHAFKTPSLRDVAERSPYMHDGSLATLDQVIDLYDRGGIERPSRADEIRPLHLSPGEKSDLLAFLKTLSGETRFAGAR